ncbi:MAG: hypothetical protein NT144_06570 [Bacteroidia bacterium]|nr:hypothetical protein [Bacteroidia bacterium]
MIKVINYIKAGARVAPAFLIVLYYLFVALDLFTTYLATPDLRYEGNWIVRFFSLNWSQFIVFYSLIALFVSLSLFIALNYLHKYYQENIKFNNALIVESFHNKKIFISFIIMGCFYSHLINLAHITINNCICYIYLHQIENALSKTSTFYVSHQSYFLLYIQIVPIIIGYVVAAYKVKQIRNKYRTMAL